MHKKYKFERRSHSYLKPLLYLALQVVLVWEIFWIVTGDAKLRSWSYLELFFCTIMIVYFMVQTRRILKRTNKKTKWDDAIDAQKFLNS